ncbi:GNAT family N-acetyltransferase [Ornithinibacillus caprae]|uniref:GNAT family N-acetyltransferase n=1 Tax=Ornithinibacillus caprae TaxID=2678566 RepID=UPI0018C6EECB|nr:GNAT family N-acetyltransferase [Ornithinibacillus caprae]
MAVVEFRKITWDNFEECIGLELHQEQKNYVASNVYSLAQSYIALLNDDLPAMTFTIYDEETMIGFIMLYHDTTEENEYGDEPCYGILRLMIDRRFQGKGYGKKAMIKALEFIMTFPQGEASAVYISYDPSNKVAKHLYSSFGFEETGKVNDVGEVIVRRELNFSFPTKKG